MGQLPNVGIECGHSKSLLVFTVLSRAGSSGILSIWFCGAEYRVRNPSPTVHMSKDRPTCFHIECKQIVKKKRDLICITTSTVSRIHRNHYPFSMHFKSETRLSF